MDILCLRPGQGFALVPENISGGNGKRAAGHETAAGCAARRSENAGLEQERQRQILRPDTRRGDFLARAAYRHRRTTQLPKSSSGPAGPGRKTPGRMA